jgi:PAS domain S-box-containing protein
MASMPSDFGSVSVDPDPESYLAAIVASSDDAIIGVSLDGYIRAWNRGAERIFGYSFGEARGQPIRLLEPPDLEGEEEDILGRVREGESVAHYETVRLRRDGRRVSVSLSVSPIRCIPKPVRGGAFIVRVGPIPFLRPTSSVTTTPKVGSREEVQR